MQSLTAVLKSVIKEQVKHVLSPVPYSPVDQLLVKNFKIFVSKIKLSANFLFVFVAIFFILTR